MHKNLNLSRIPTDGFEPDTSLKDNSFRGTNIQFEEFEVIFKSLEEHLIRWITEYKDGVIFGCVAWLTSPQILDALALCNHVQIIVQKEDFLRPDFNSKNHWKKRLHQRYNNLKCGLDKMTMRESVSRLSYAWEPGIEAVRCVGNHNTDKSPAHPRSHHKFLVFCRAEGSYFRGEKEIPGVEMYYPEAVWTGSFNFTLNGGNSLENAVVFRDKSGLNPFINSYLEEHHQIFGLSEKLNWEQPWSEPQFRIGS